MLKSVKSVDDPKPTLPCFVSRICSQAPCSLAAVDYFLDFSDCVHTVPCNMLLYVFTFLVSTSVSTHFKHCQYQDPPSLFPVGLICPLCRPQGLLPPAPWMVSWSVLPTYLLSPRICLSLVPTSAANISCPSQHHWTGIAKLTPLCSFSNLGSSIFFFSLFYS